MGRSVADTPRERKPPSPFFGSIAESAGKNPLEFGTQWVVGPAPWEDLHRFGLAFSEAWGNDPSPSGVLWCGCVSETGGFPKIRELGVLPGIGKTIAVRSGRRGDTLVAPVIVSDRLFLKRVARQHGPPLLHRLGSILRRRGVPGQWRSSRELGPRSR